jgi:hypothetical protein
MEYSENVEGGAGQNRFALTYASRKELVKSERQFNFEMRKDCVQGVDRRGGTEVEFFCSKGCGYHMRYHCKRETVVDSNTGLKKKISSGIWKASQGSKDFTPCIYHSDICESVSNLRVPELAAMPHVKAASVSTGVKTTVKGLQEQTAVLCHTSTTSYKLRAAILKNRDKEDFFSMHLAGKKRVFCSCSKRRSLLCDALVLIRSEGLHEAAAKRKWRDSAGGGRRNFRGVPKHVCIARCLQDILRHHLPTNC